MTIPVNRGMVALAAVIPLGAVFVGIPWAMSDDSVDWLGIELPEPIAIGLGLALVAAGLVGASQLLWQTVRPTSGLTWDEDTVDIRFGVGPAKRIPRQTILAAQVSRSWPGNIELKLEDRGSVDIYAWMLKLPDGWSREAVADALVTRDGAE